MNSCAYIHVSHVCAAIQNLFLFNKQMFPSLICACVLSLFPQQNFLVRICFSNLICIIKQSMQQGEPMLQMAESYSLSEQLKPNKLFLSCAPLLFCFGKPKPRIYEYWKTLFEITVWSYFPAWFTEASSVQGELMNFLYAKGWNDS